MAGNTPHSSRGPAGARQRNVPRRQEPQSGPGRGRVLVGLILGLGLVGGVIVADDLWSWRDSLRRIAKGEVVPAFRANAWADARAVKESLADSLLTSEFSPSVDDWETRRDLALHILIVAAGEETISREAAAMGALMEELCVDVDWLEEMVCFCPMEHAQAALPILAHLYKAEKKKMAAMPVNRRLASAVAFEFARAGLGAQAAHEAYLIYASSGQKHWLNNRFDGLSLWEMRVIAARLTDSQWAARETLTWFQRNNRLPARGYVQSGNALGRHETSLLGAEVDSPAFFSLYRGASEGGVASVYEASGCSTAASRAHYAATAACANGVPALVVSAAGEAICLVDVDGRWEASGPMPEGGSSSWRFCEQQHPDFAQLASRLGSEREKTLASFRLASLGQYLYDAGNVPLAHSCFREAVKVQPLNYAAWAAFLAAGASGEEREAAQRPFEQLPGVAAVLKALPVK